MIDGRDPYTVPLFGPQGDVEKPAAATAAKPTGDNTALLDALHDLETAKARLDGLLKG